MAHAIHDALLDEDGFLVDPASWSSQVAEQLAREDGIGALGEEHWEVIRTLRDHYMRSRGIPAFSHVCQVNGFDKRCLDGLFKSPREAWRIAGLPNPGEEAKAYM
jgi:TusE/DsrC/DsvC family sulfur relay protein